MLMGVPPLLLSNKMEECVAGDPHGWKPTASSARGQLIIYRPAERYDVIITCIWITPSCIRRNSSLLQVFRPPSKIINQQVDDHYYTIPGFWQ